jgi:hypothetical protein
MRRALFSVVLAALLGAGQLGVLVHGLLHRVDAEPAVTAHAGDSHHHEDSDSRPCNAFDGLTAYIACVAFALLFPLPRGPVAASRYQSFQSITRVAYRARGPPVV